jgi:hypothetical protein
LFRVEVDGRRVALRLDGGQTIYHDLAVAPDRIALLAEGVPAAFTGFALSAGWLDEFDNNMGYPGPEWTSDQPSQWVIQAREVVYTGRDESLLWRGPFFDAYDLVVNVRLLDGGGTYGIVPTLSADGDNPVLTVERMAEGWAACYGAPGRSPDGRLVFPLPAAFDPFVYQQFRFLKEDGRLRVFWEQHAIADLPASPTATAIGLFARGGAAFDMVRVSAVPFSTLIPLPAAEKAWKPTTPSFGQPA